MSEQMDRITRYINERTLAEDAARQRAVVAMFASAAAAENVPYARAGYEPWRLYTRAQWEMFDDFNAHCDEREAKFGRFAPSMFTATMRATARVIF